MRNPSEGNPSEGNPSTCTVDEKEKEIRGRVELQCMDLWSTRECVSSSIFYRERDEIYFLLWIENKYSTVSSFRVHILDREGDSFLHFFVSRKR